MFVYSSAKGSHMYHTEQCAHAKRIKPAHYALFQTKKDAEEAGYYSCSCCSRLGKHLKREEKQVQDFCKREQYTCRFEKGRIVITTPLEKWLLVHDVNLNKVVLYHQNHSLKAKPDSPIEGYHVQAHQFMSVCSTLHYIYKHTRSYLEQPNVPTHIKEKVCEVMGLPMPSTKVNLPAPMSRRKRGKRKREIKEIRKRCDVRHVLDLIDALGDNGKE